MLGLKYKKISGFPKFAHINFSLKLWKLLGVKSKATCVGHSLEKCLMDQFLPNLDSKHRLPDSKDSVQ